MPGVWDDLPRYFIVGYRPVKVVTTRNGGIRVLAYDPDTREFTPDPSYMSRIFFDRADGVDEVTEDQFEAEVAGLGSAGS